VINNSLATVGDDEPIHKSRFFWLKIASIVVFVLALVGIGYWFIFPMLKDPTKAYIAFKSESKIKDIHFLTNIDEHNYEIISRRLMRDYRMGKIGKFFLEFPKN